MYNFEFRFCWVELFECGFKLGWNREFWIGFDFKWVWIFN